MSKTLINGKDIFATLSEALKAQIVALKPGELLAVYMRNVSTDESKVQVEFAEKINLSTQPRSALALFNPGDDRFSSGARRAWATMDRAWAEAMFGKEIPEGEPLVEIGQIMKPLSGGTQDLRIQVREMKEGDFTEDQKEYKDNYLKTIPSTGAFFYATDDNQRVGSTTQVVIVDRNSDGTKGDVGHQLIKGAYRVDGAGAVLTGASETVSDELVS